MNRRDFLTSAAASASLGPAVFAAARKAGRAPSVLLRSSWQSVNIGDIGHTPGTLRVIEEHLPELKVIVWAMKVDERILAMLKRRFGQELHPFFSDAMSMEKRYFTSDFNKRS